MLMEEKNVFIAEPDGCGMDNSGGRKRESWYVFFAALCFVIIEVYYIAYESMIRFYDPYCFTMQDNLVSMVNHAIGFGLVLALLFKNKMACIVVVGINVALSLWNILPIEYVELHTWVNLLSLVTLAAVLVLALRGNKILKMTWFIPALPQIVAIVVDFGINKVSFPSDLDMIGILCSLGKFKCVFACVAFALTGLWLKNSTARGSLLGDADPIQS